MINVKYCGICGSDIPRVFDGAAHGYPLVLGHEFSGVVAAVGDKVNNVNIGNRVVAAPLIPCMHCSDCDNGNYSLCRNYSFIGSRIWGAMADYVKVPDINVIKIPDSIPFDLAATIEPATVGLHALMHCKFKSGATVAVLGCGIIGLDTIQWAKINGAASVTAISRGEDGLRAAANLGANTYSTTTSTAESILNDFPRGFDYVFECSGSDATIHLALRIVGKKGTICYVGTPKRELNFSIKDWENINRKECWVTGSWMSYSHPFPGKEWTETIKCMSDGKFKAIPERVYKKMQMKDGSEAFGLIRAGKSKGRILLGNEF